MRYLILFITILCQAAAQDCAPEALHAFALGRGLKSDKAEWYKLCKPDSVGSDLKDVLAAWQKLHPDHPFSIILCADVVLSEKGIDETAPQVISLRELHKELAGIPRLSADTTPDKPYLWLGICQGGFHVAILYVIDENTIRIIHPNTIDPSTKKPYVELVDPADFMRRTYVVFNIK
jgi:hypothetical protein